ncbi:hypothetical protein CI610_00994 [invertebrate metagenome]|uniref:Uncharacterized protein n=1 Tax=invertebrate metagenome TaxID=1711999 RepID=A0A2H9T9Y0_9ZZZZ
MHIRFNVCWLDNMKLVQFTLLFFVFYILSPLPVLGTIDWLKFIQDIDTDKKHLFSKFKFSLVFFLHGDERNFFISDENIGAIKKDIFTRFQNRLQKTKELFDEITAIVPVFKFPILSINEDHIAIIKEQAYSLGYKDWEINATTKPTNCPQHYWHLMVIIDYLIFKENKVPRKPTTKPEEFHTICEESDQIIYPYLYFIMKHLFRETSNDHEQYYKDLTEIWLDLRFQKKKIAFNWRLWIQSDYYTPPELLTPEHKWKAMTIDNITIWSLECD